MSKLTKYQNSSIAESDKIGNIFKRVKSLITNLSNRVDSIESGSFDTSNLVDKTTNQTIGGVKTFTLSPVVPTTTTNMQASTKKYVDDKVSVDYLKGGIIIKILLHNNDLFCSIFIV